MATRKQTHEALAGPTRLKEWRIKNAMTQAALAERIGVSRENFCRIEGGKRHLGLRIASAIERETGIPTRCWVAS